MKWWRVKLFPRLFTLPYFFGNFRLTCQDRALSGTDGYLGFICTEGAGAGVDGWRGKWSEKNRPSPPNKIWHPSKMAARNERASSRLIYIKMRGCEHSNYSLISELYHFIAHWYYVWQITLKMVAFYLAILSRTPRQWKVYGITFDLSSPFFGIFWQNTCWNPSWCALSSI